jgi:hypothetical protein
MLLLKEQDNIQLCSRKILASCSTHEKEQDNNPSIYNIDNIFFGTSPESQYPLIINRLGLTIIIIRIMKETKYS